METIKIRKINKGDIKNAKAFMNYINTLISENAMIGRHTKVTMKEEKEFLKNAAKSSKQKVFLVLVNGNTPIGVTNISLEKNALNHIGTFGISIAQEYRGQGFGKKLMVEVINYAKENFDPKPKIIQLRVYAVNKPAVALYKKLGFKIVATLPKQIQYKGKLISEHIMNKYL